MHGEHSPLSGVNLLAWSVYCYFPEVSSKFLSYEMHTDSAFIALSNLLKWYGRSPLYASVVSESAASWI